ncbi:Outer membrane protein beta-barrel domain-containing protein [Hymenobacter mucosus]|uniref:Outer membrane protein beta-barrel domain-containing protein n=1 Tax=Hymenobacter mucosus TaxID=1411120 RepID=A0A239B4U8_9BACT|nr:Outer membrane protein beta-barrel domain-containing protein [Hymenobacter mucosus]
MLGTSIVQAQSVLTGLKGGVAIANAIGRDATGSTLRFGCQGGLALRLRPYKHLGIQVEALYAQRGDNSTSYGPSLGHQLNYLTIPVVAQYHFGDIFFEGGGQYGRLLSAKPVQEQRTAIGRAAFNPQDMGFLVGFGYQDTTGLMVGWRYIGGLSNVYRRVDLAGSSQVQLRNSAMEFYLGYVVEPIKIVRGSGHFAVGTAKLVFVKTPVLLFKGVRFLLYTGPSKLVRAIRGKDRPAPTAPEVSSTTPVLPASPTPANWKRHPLQRMPLPVCWGSGPDLLLYCCRVVAVEMRNRLNTL